MLDFHPALLGVVAAWVLILHATGSRAGRAAGMAAAATLSLGSVFNVLTSFHTHWFFRDTNPRLYSQIRDKADRLIWPLARHVVEPPGARELTIVFPANPKPGTVEPLLVTGVHQDTNELLIQYLGEGKAWLLFVHAKASQVHGPVFQLPRGSCKAQLWMGNLMPPIDHPAWDGAEWAHQQQVRNAVRVVIDGATVLDVQAPCYLSPPNLWSWGKATWPSWYERTFSGQICSVDRIGTPAAAAAERFDRTADVTLTLKLPQDRFGSTEPLATIGDASEQSLVAIHYVDTSHIRLVYIKGTELTPSATVELDYEQPHTFRLRSPHSGAGCSTGTLQISLDEFPVATFVTGSKFANATMVPLSNVAPATPCRATFAGETLRIAFDHDAPLTNTILPAVMLGGSGQRINLLTTGSDQGGRSTLALMPISSGRTQLIWQSVTGKIEQTEIVHDESPSASLAVQLADGELRLTWDGDEVWRKIDQGFSAACVEFWPVLVNASASDIHLSVQRFAQPAIPRPVFLRVYFPLGRTGAAEPLVTSGVTGAGDGVYVKYLSADTLAFGFDHWGVGGPTSAPIKIDYSIPHSLWIRYQALSPDSVPAAPFTVWLDGIEVFKWEKVSHPTDGQTVEIGKNRIGLSTQGPAFTGKILEKRRLRKPLSPNLRLSP
jgi:hypothetical protein